MILTSWLGKMPNNWACVPAWSLFSERSEKAKPGSVHLTPSQLYGVLPQSEYMEITGSRVVLNLKGADSMKAVCEGDFISHLRSFQGGLEQSSLHGKVSQAYTVLRPSDQVHGGFFRYLFKSRIFIEQLNNLTDQLRDGQTINYARFARMALPLPPLETQGAIAQYLDSETGDIDAMMANLIELEQVLIERRSVMILDATRQGKKVADGEAMPASYESLEGEWSLLPLKYAVEDPQTGVWGEEADGGSDDVRCARVADFDRLSICVTEVPTMRSVPRKDRLRCGLERGDILVEKSGGTRRNPVGGVVAYMGDTPAVYSNFIIRLRCRQSQHPRFWLYVLHGSYIAGRTWSYVRQTTGIQNLDVNGFMSMNHPVPDFDEQRRIADHLDEVTSRIDAMLTRIDELKALLAERRAALITDVVTGRKKIPS